MAAERKRSAKQMNEQFEAFANDPSLPLPTETLAEDVERRSNELMEVESDSEEKTPRQPKKGASAKTRSEWFGQGPDYDMSFRTLQYSDVVTNEQREARIAANLAKQQDDQEGPVDEKMERSQKADTDRKVAFGI